MPRDFEEWLKQADYDLDTADFMFKGKRYIYAVFMCHLSIEKALKGLYLSLANKIPHLLVIRIPHLKVRKVLEIQ